MATSRLQRLHRLELGEVGVHDPGEGDLVEVDLLAQDQVEQEVEGPLEHRRASPRRPSATMLITSVWFAGARTFGPEAGTPTIAAPCPASSPASSPPARSTSATTSGPSAAGSTTSTSTTPSTAWSTSTPSPSPRTRRSSGAKTRELMALLVAAGLDPEVCTLFVQSQVPEHAQLAWLMECTASFGELRRMTQFKEKGDRAEFTSAGLFTYPALMAADILLYDTDRVPVGDDQRQHLELARDVAERFNHRYGDTFVVPEHAIPPVGARIMDLQEPTRKMSKSVDSPQGTVLVLDPPEVHRPRRSSGPSPTPTARCATTPTAKPGVANLLSILGAATGERPGGARRPLRAVRAAQGRHRRGGRRAAAPAPGALRRAAGRPGRGRPRSSPRGAEKAQAARRARPRPGDGRRSGLLPRCR